MIAGYSPITHNKGRAIRERPPDISINITRPDLRVSFGGYDIEVCKPLDIWVLGPAEAPPAGCATETLDTGEIVAIRPREESNDETSTIIH